MAPTKTMTGAGSVSVDLRELSLGERAGRLTANAVTPVGALQAARQRMAWWSEAFFRHRAVSFRNWLSLEGLTPAQAANLVLRDDCLQLPRGTLAWADTRSDVLGGSTFANVRLAEGLSGAVAQPGLSVALFPYVRWALARLRGASATKANTRAGAGGMVEARFAAYLLSRLQAVAMPTLGLTINMARVSGALRGETPEERFLDFTQQLADPNRRADALARFPVLDRVLADMTALTTEAVLAPFDHLDQDQIALARAFGVDPHGLTDIEFGQGDPHCGARSVAILSFDTIKVVYKPKSLAVDVAFNALIDWLGGWIDPAPKSLGIIERGDHGWSAYVVAKPCRTNDEIRRYYRRLGSLLALLHLCRGVDVHFENLISSGDHPYAIDLETLLRRDPPRPYGRAAAALRRSAARNRTVLGVGLLPEWAVGAEGLFDLSGAGADADQVAMFKQPKFEGFERDDPRIVYEKTMLSVHANVPRIAEARQPITAFAEDLLDGFRAAYQAVLKGREELLSEAGPLAAFNNVRTRWVARPTVQYALAMRDSYHPTHMRDGIDHEIAFSALADGVDEAPHLYGLMASEKRDMWSGDVPYFSCVGSERDLRDSRDSVVCSSFFAETAGELVASAVKGMGPDDLSRQESIIRTAIKARVMIGGTSQPDDPIARPNRRAEAGRFIEAAVGIGDDLVRRAVAVDDCAYWVGFVQRGESNYAASILDDSLYDGSAGIAVFLAELARITGSRTHRDTARRALNAVRHAHYGLGGKARIGAFDGWAGSLYAELRVGACLGFWPERRLRRLLGLIRRAAPFDIGFDIISGSAGAALVALRLVGTSLEDEAIATARVCARRLADAGERGEDGANWETGPQKRRLTGFAHGVAGIALALQAVGRATGEEALLQMAARALLFERATFDRKKRNWRDLRGSPERATAWCHGAAGITLSRIALSRYLDDPAIDAEIAAGAAAIRRHGAGGSHCLCHGALGNAEPLLLHGATSRSAALDLAANALAEFEAEGRWRCGVSDFADTPGLMLGLAGIGYGLLRVALPRNLPSVLLLETSQTVAS